MQSNELNDRVVIVGCGPIDIALLRAVMADRHDVIMVDRALSSSTYTSAAAPMDRELAQRLRREQDIRDWNAAVDAKKTARHERRNARRWSRP